MNESEAIPKILVARRLSPKQCTATEGEWLLPAWPDRRSPVRFRTTDHFFVGLETGEACLYGWVDAAPADLTQSALLERALSGPARHLLGGSSENVEHQIMLTLRAIRNLPLGVPVVTDFSIKSVFDKERVQKIHRVFFR